MAWIESHTVLMRHRKVVNLALSLRLRKSHTIGHLHALWHAALEQQDDGDLSAWSDEFIADQSDFPGDAPQYVRLLQENGFFGYLDGDKKIIPGTERLLHDWWTHAKSFLNGRYKSTNPEKLKEIQAKHSPAPQAVITHSGVTPELLPLPTHLPTVPTHPSARVSPDELSAEVDRYIGAHSGLLWSHRLASRVRKLVESAGWEETKMLIDEACAKGTTDPVAYASMVHTGNQAKERLGKNGTKKNRSAVAVREDN